MFSFLYLLFFYIETNTKQNGFLHGIVCFCQCFFKIHGVFLLQYLLNWSISSQSIKVYINEFLDFSLIIFHFFMILKIVKFKHYIFTEQSLNILNFTKKFNTIQTYRNILKYKFDGLSNYWKKKWILISQII